MLVGNRKRLMRNTLSVFCTLNRLGSYIIFMERVAGIEPASSAWKAEVLPLNYTRRINRNNYLPTLRNAQLFKMVRSSLNKRK